MWKENISISTILVMMVTLQKPTTTKLITADRMFPIQNMDSISKHLVTISPIHFPFWMLWWYVELFVNDKTQSLQTVMRFWIVETEAWV